MDRGTQESGKEVQGSLQNAAAALQGVGEGKGQRPLLTAPVLAAQSPWLPLSNCLRPGELTSHPGISGEGQHP